MIKPELIIFDMDGLMFDTERIALTAWRQAAAKFGYQVDSEIFMETVGSDARRTQEIYTNHLGPDFPYQEVREERFIITEQIIEKDGVPVKPGLRELLELLNRIGIKKAVATSTSREKALALLQRAGVDKDFDLIVCGDQVARSKPEPDIFLKAAATLHCQPEKCLVLEDSEAGVLAASRGKMPAIIIPDIKEPTPQILKLAHKRMSSLTEVVAYIKQLFAI